MAWSIHPPPRERCFTSERRSFLYDSIDRACVIDDEQVPIMIFGEGRNEIDPAALRLEVRGVILEIIRLAAVQLE